MMPVAAICTACLMMAVEECDPENPTRDLEILLDPSMAEPQKAVVSVHEIVRYPRANEHEQKIPSYFGNEVTINRLPLLFSKEIMSITAIPRVSDPDFYDLRVKLTSRGRKMWIGLSVPNQKTNLAFVIDGMYYRSFRPRMIYDDVTDEIIIDGPFDKATALEVQNNAEKNYKKAN